MARTAVAVVVAVVWIALLAEVSEGTVTGFSRFAGRPRQNRHRVEVRTTAAPAVLKEASAEEGGPEFDMGVSAFNRRDFDQAEKHFAAYVAEHPDDADGWNNLGETMLQLGRVEEALVDLQTAVKLAPASHDFWFNLGVAYNRVGRGNDARKAYDEAIKHTNQKYDPSWAYH